MQTSGSSSPEPTQETNTSNLAIASASSSSEDESNPTTSPSEKTANMVLRVFINAKDRVKKDKTISRAQVATRKDALQALYVNFNKYLEKVNLINQSDPSVSIPMFFEDKSADVRLQLYTQLASNFSKGIFTLPEFLEKSLGPLEPVKTGFFVKGWPVEKDSADFEAWLDFINGILGIFIANAESDDDPNTPLYISWAGNLKGLCAQPTISNEATTHVAQKIKELRDAELMSTPASVVTARRTRTVRFDDPAAGTEEKDESSNDDSHSSSPSVEYPLKDAGDRPAFLPVKDDEDEEGRPAKDAFGETTSIGSCWFYLKCCAGLVATLGGALLLVGLLMQPAAITALVFLAETSSLQASAAVLSGGLIMYGLFSIPASKANIVAEETVGHGESTPDEVAAWGHTSPLV